MDCIKGFLMTAKKTTLKRKVKSSSAKTEKKRSPVRSLGKKAASKRGLSSNMLDLTQSNDIEEIKNEIQAAIVALGNSDFVKKIEELLERFEKDVRKKGAKITHKLGQVVKKSTKAAARKKSTSKKKDKTKPKTAMKKTRTATKKKSKR